MVHNTIQINIELNTPIDRVWKALTDKNEMKKWYFNISDFEPELGYIFRFEGGEEHKRYLHLCKVLEVIPKKKLKYSWEYPTYPGLSYVSFLLSSTKEGTMLTLIHKDIESFTNPDFKPEKFKDGWNFLLHESLKGFLEEGKELRTW